MQRVPFESIADQIRIDRRQDNELMTVSSPDLHMWRVNTHTRYGALLTSEIMVDARSEDSVRRMMAPDSDEDTYTIEFDERPQSPIAARVDIHTPRADGKRQVTNVGVVSLEAMLAPEAVTPDTRPAT